MKNQMYTEHTVSDRTMQKPNSTFHMTCQWISMKFGIHANIVII